MNPLAVAQHLPPAGAPVGYPFPTVDQYNQALDDNAIWPQFEWWRTDFDYLYGPYLGYVIGQTLSTRESVNQVANLTLNGFTGHWYIPIPNTFKPTQHVFVESLIDTIARHFYPRLVAQQTYPMYQLLLHRDQPTGPDDFDLVFTTALMSGTDLVRNLDQVFNTNPATINQDLPYWKSHSGSKGDLELHDLIETIINTPNPDQNLYWELHVWFVHLQDQLHAHPSLHMHENDFIQFARLLQGDYSLRVRALGYQRPIFFLPRWV
ncbi:hypothetical protein BaRGS_00040593 [Batillaria attramentaria]|uniref:Uncharacterized protein n=1 Tax=Batillaria attramentaria TaxID=370345 RepID=A0ABD0IZ43_9CAEN